MESEGLEFERKKNVYGLCTERSLYSESVNFPETWLEIDTYVDVKVYVHRNSYVFVFVDLNERGQRREP